MTDEKTLPKRSMMCGLIERVVELSDRELSDAAKLEMRSALARGLESYKDPELYDILDRVGAMDGCQVSKFVQALCRLSRYYMRPSE